VDVDEVELVGLFEDSGDVRHLEHLEVVGTVRLGIPGRQPIEACPGSESPVGWEVHADASLTSPSVRLTTACSHGPANVAARYAREHGCRQCQVHHATPGAPARRRAVALQLVRCPSSSWYGCSSSSGYGCSSRWLKQLVRLASATADHAVRGTVVDVQGVASSRRIQPHGNTASGTSPRSFVGLLGTETPLVPRARTLVGSSLSSNANPSGRSTRTR